MKKYHAIAAGLLLGTTLMLGASPAMARVDVDVSIGVPGVYFQPAPVYVQPQPYYVEPAPVYVQPRPVYVQPRPVYVQPQPFYIEQQYRQDWREHRWHGHRRHGWRYRDGDGNHNRHDRDDD